MRVPRWLKCLAAILVVVALIREINGAGAINLYEIVMIFEDFEFNSEGIEKLVNVFSGDFYGADTGDWYEKLLFVLIAIRDFFVALWQIFKESFSILGLILKVVLKVLGIA